MVTEPHPLVQTTAFVVIDVSRREGIVTRHRNKSSKGGHRQSAKKARNNENVHLSSQRRALAVLSRMRKGESLSGAAHAEHTTPRTVRNSVGSALIRNPRTKRYVAKRSDTIRRDVNILAADGFMPTTVSSFKRAQFASQHLIAVNRPWLIVIIPGAWLLTKWWRKLRLRKNRAVAPTKTS